MRNLLCGIITFYLFSLVSCQDGPDQLVGDWQATKLLENGDSLSVDPTLIRFQFTDQGRYRFESTLNYTEAGNYRMDGPLLYTLDTMQSSGIEKAVLLNWVTTDTLLVQMQDKGSERQIVLVRKDED